MLQRALREEEKERVKREICFLFWSYDSKRQALNVEETKTAAIRFTLLTLLALHAINISYINKHFSSRCSNDSFVFPECFARHRGYGRLLRPVFCVFLFFIFTFIEQLKQ